MSERETNRARWLDYLAQRTGSYHFRARRYATVAVELARLGLADGDLVYDVGAGQCEFGKYLYGSGWTGRYVPVDGAIDGTELDIWRPLVPADFFVAIEVVEHLANPLPMLAHFEGHATKGAVITTPNADVVDVRALDPTHFGPVYRATLEARGWNAYAAPLFGKTDDTLVATWTPPR